MRRRVDDQQPCARRDEPGQLLDVEPEVVLHPDGDRHRRGADEPRERLVDRIARVGHDHLVAGVDQPQDRVQHHALAADRDEHLGRIGREPLARGHVVGDRPAQLGDARKGGVVGRTLIEGALRRLPDVGRRVEIGLADLEMDHRPALGL
jgi:hypothetical protein